MTNPPNGQAAEPIDLKVAETQSGAMLRRDASVQAHILPLARDRAAALTRGGGRCGNSRRQLSRGATAEPAFGENAGPVE